jgi:hypothetical protein
MTRRCVSGIRWFLPVVTAALVLGAGALTATASAPANYVALGDSYTADPGVSGLASGISPLCVQSSADYPHRVGPVRGLATTDVSCSGATSSDMTSSQYPGVDPQFDALSSATNVVTVGIGGNDNNLFIGALVACGITDLPDFLNIGSPCEFFFGNTFADAIASDASTIAGVIKGIHARAPGAKVFVVGYPDILPQSGNCYPKIPLTTGDTAYLNGVEKDLNAMLSSEAGANSATFINTFTPSIGHDACKSGSAQWVNAIVATSGGISVHPTPNGVADTSTLVEAALAAKGF